VLPLPLPPPPLLQQAGSCVVQAASREAAWLSQPPVAASVSL